MARAWPAFDIHVPGCDPQLQELVLAELDDFHPTAIQEHDDPPKLRVFFTSTVEREAAAGALASAFGIHIFVESIDVEDDNWAARSQADLRAITVGRIIVAPPWDAAARTDAAGSPLTVVIQPSMGFGTGHHATTRLMLKALQTLPVGGRRVLDIGCGSGVLAIAAAGLGATSALGIEIDPDALESAAENVALNGVAGRVELQQADFHDLRTTAAIVMANLTGALLEREAATLAGLVEPGGHLIVSGFMETETAVVPALAQFVMLLSADGEDEWRCAIFKR